MRIGGRSRSRARPAKARLFGCGCPFKIDFLEAVPDSALLPSRARLMRNSASLVCWIVGLCWLPAVHAQTVKVMQWNVKGYIGNIASNNTAQAKAIARILNYNQPDVITFCELD